MIWWTTWLASPSIFNNINEQRVLNQSSWFCKGQQKLSITTKSQQILFFLPSATLLHTYYYHSLLRPTRTRLLFLSEDRRRHQIFVFLQDRISDMQAIKCVVVGDGAVGKVKRCFLTAIRGRLSIGGVIRSIYLLLL